VFELKSSYSPSRARRSGRLWSTRSSGSPHSWGHGRTVHRRVSVNHAMRRPCA